MILTYSNRRFPPLILQKIKIHTIREDKTNRWHAGRSIQHWMHNPRNVKKDPFHFLDSSCISTQQIDIEPQIKMVRVDGRMLTDKEINKLAKRDGLTNARVFFTWFNTSFSGKIIHWTDLKY